jgi:hypothetical protein
MNRINKNVTVHFFAIEADFGFTENFSSSYIANRADPSNTRILSIRTKKYLIKISNKFNFENSEIFPITIVRERNTWQTKATIDGKIKGISLNQGIIGDPYYFFVVPGRNLLLGLTTGPSGSVKSVGRTLLNQFI